MDLRARVDAERVTRGLTVAELSRRAEVDGVHLLRWIRGDREMSSDRLARVLEVLELVRE